MSGKLTTVQPGLPGLMIADVPPSLLAQALRTLNLDSSATVYAPADVIEAAREWYGRLQHMMRGATAKEMEDQLTALADHPGWMPEALRSGDEARAAIFWAAFAADLRDVPPFALADACRMARLDEDLKRFPRSAELLAWARKCERWREGLKAVEGLRRLKGAHVERARVPAGTDAEWAEIRAKLDAMKSAARREEEARE